MTGTINTRSVSFALGLLCVCLALIQQGLFVGAKSTTVAATPVIPGVSAATSDGKTTSQLNTTSGRNSTMAPMIQCYNDTSLNTSCSSGTGICYASIMLSTGSVSLACKSLNATPAPVCASYFALTSAGGAGRCEFCCSVALCNKDKANIAWMKPACCATSQGQGQAVCASAASRLDIVGVTTQVVVTVTVTSIVCTIVKTINFS